MRTGAATLGALQAGAKEIVDPRPFAVGEILSTYETWPNIGRLLPAIGYGSAQIHDLEVTVARAARGGIEAIAIGTPIDLSHLITITIPWTRVRYELRVVSDTSLEDALAPVFATLENAGKFTSR
jgi:predicted GTPase